MRCDADMTSRRKPNDAWVLYELWLYKGFSEPIFLFFSVVPISKHFIFLSDHLDYLRLVFHFVILPPLHAVPINNHKISNLFESSIESFGIDISGHTTFLAEKEGHWVVKATKPGQGSIKRLVATPVDVVRPNDRGQLNHDVLNSLNL